MEQANNNKTLLVTSPGTDQVMLVIAVILDQASLDLEHLLSGIVPEMVKGSVPGGLLVVGDTTLVIRAADQEVQVDEIATASLLALADIDEEWGRDTIVPMMQRWIAVLSKNWRDHVIGDIKELLVPHLVAGLAGEVMVCDGVWGMDSHRVASSR